jgi:hypothetical protein
MNTEEEDPICREGESAPPILFPSAQPPANRFDRWVDVFRPLPRWCSAMSGLARMTAGVKE